MHHYPHHIGDYRKDTAHLSLLEHGVYRQLLDTYYTTEKPLTLDDAFLMRTHCARSADEMQALRNVLNDFFVRTDDGWVHKRCDIEIEAYQAKSSKAGESAKARWDRVRAEKDANALPTQCQPNANQEPRTKNQDIKPSCDSRTVSRFNDFWKAYPSSQRKVAKKTCRDKWVAKKFDRFADEIIADVVSKSDSKQWRDGFSPAPLTYLNQERWGDDPVKSVLDDWRESAA